MKDLRYLEHDWYPRPLPAGVEIGAGSWVYSSFAFLHCRSEKTPCVRVGSNSGVYEGTFFDLGPDGEVVIGDYCALVGAIINTNGRVVIEDYTLIAHDVVISDNIASRPPRTGERIPRASGIRIGENSWIGARATLLGGAVIGEGTIVGAGAVVDFETPPYSIVAGNPARVVGFAHAEQGGAR